MYSLINMNLGAGSIKHTFCINLKEGSAQTVSPRAAQQCSRAGSDLTCSTAKEQVNFHTIAGLGSCAMPVGVITGNSPHVSSVAGISQHTGTQRHYTLYVLVTGR